MSQNFLERCNEKMQSLYDCCGKKVNELYAKLAEDVQSLYNHCKAQASELVAKLLEKVQLLYNDCLEKIAAVIAQVKAVIAVAAAVAKIQLTMLERRVRLHVMSIVNKLQAKQQEIVGRMKARYHALLSTWRRNQHFTFWFIPADGQNIAKTHVKKTHLKYALTAVASFLVFVSCTIGVLAHFAVQNEQQKQELAAYKQTKSEQEQTIRQLRLKPTRRSWQLYQSWKTRFEARWKKAVHSFLLRAMLPITQVRAVLYWVLPTRQTLCWSRKRTSVLRPMRKKLI